jgi:hypothetical protein
LSKTGSKIVKAIDRNRVDDMAKQLNVNLAFNADTAKAKAQIQDLQSTLNKLVKDSVSLSASGQLPITKELNEAQIAATKLSTILS